MEIKFIGWQSFLIKDKKLAVLTQPFSAQEKKGGFPKTAADIVLSRRLLPRPARSKIVANNASRPVFFSGPGEYESAGIDVIGYPFGFWFKFKGLGVFWLTENLSAGQKNLPVGETDVLLMGQGAGKSEAEKMKKTVEMFSPLFLIPFPLFSLSEQALLSGGWAKEFLDIFDQEGLKPLDAVKISPPEDRQEGRKIVFLKPLLKSK